MAIRFTPATLAVTTLMWAEATMGYFPPGTYEPTLFTGMFRWPRITPGIVSCSTSRSADFWIRAKLRICVCANSTSARSLALTRA